MCQLSNTPRNIRMKFMVVIANSFYFALSDTSPHFGSYFLTFGSFYTRLTTIQPKASNLHEIMWIGIG